MQRADVAKEDADVRWMQTTKHNEREQLKEEVEACNNVYVILIMSLLLGYL